MTADNRASRDLSPNVLFMLLSIRLSIYRILTPMVYLSSRLIDRLLPDGKDSFPEIADILAPVTCGSVEGRP